jgi:predicted transcriptional regulator
MKAGVDASKIVETFYEALGHAGLTPRDISPVMGLHLSSLYRVLSGRTPTTMHTLRSLEMATVFLRWLRTCGIVKDSPLEYFEQWVKG